MSPFLLTLSLAPKKKLELTSAFSAFPLLSLPPPLSPPPNLPSISAHPKTSSKLAAHPVRELSVPPTLNVGVLGLVLGFIKSFAEPGEEADAAARGR